MIDAAEVEAAFLAACRDEIEAPKPGNVHIFGSGHGMTAEHFLVSAAASAKVLCTPGKPVGQRIHDAVAASFAAVGMNTNLGIVLLCAPLAAAAERTELDAALQTALAKVLVALDKKDTQHVFAAIRLANPGGLGTAARYDVHGAADVTLLLAMGEAAERDRIAAQYISNFHDVFVTGLTTLDRAHGCGLKPPWSTIAVYLTFLAAFPDSHISRKHGSATALEVQREASEMLSLFQTKGEKCLSDLLAFDEGLKSRRRNPGTSADLTVATLFADRLRNILLKHRNDG
ncbi:MAG: triphosphoribosyl-dephospho-CoA synthase [Methylovirgula sp.]